MEVLKQRGAGASAEGYGFTKLSQEEMDAIPEGPPWALKGSAEDDGHVGDGIVMVVESEHNEGEQSLHHHCTITAPSLHHHCTRLFEYEDVRTNE